MAEAIAAGGGALSGLELSLGRDPEWLVAAIQGLGATDARRATVGELIDALSAAIPLDKSARTVT